MSTSTMTGRPSILLIYTGGTIGMKVDPSDQTLKPFDFSQIAEEVPELKKFAGKTDSITFDPLIDSSDVEPSFWQKLARTIQDNYDAYDGFVILHGTDTMSYSASVLSFMVRGLTKPVIFTGSQLPVGIPRSDGKENLVSAVEIAAAKDASGHALVPEVSIYFNEKLMRGNRTTKVNSEGFSAFRSPNYPPLAEAGINIRYNNPLVLRPESWDKAPSWNTGLDTRVSILKVHPGITPQTVRDILLGPGTRAVIMETFGSGNAPSRGWFIDMVREAAAEGKILVNVSQCIWGSVDMGLYATGRALREAGVLSGFDSTTESALGKLFHLMGISEDNGWVKEHMLKNLRGEIDI